jgi:succinate dehydrogenase/fumarate reductase cytochrome b subunit
MILIQIWGLFHFCLGIWCLTNLIEKRTREQQKTSFWIGSLSVLLGLFFIFRTEQILGIFI